jgi:hypothetical protein
MGSQPVHRDHQVEPFQRSGPPAGIDHVRTAVVVVGVVVAADSRVIILPAPYIVTAVQGMGAMQAMLAMAAPRLLDLVDTVS